MVRRAEMNGVHQIEVPGRKGSGWVLEVDEYVNALPEKTTDARKRALQRSDLIKAFEANAPDVRRCRSDAAKRRLLGDFLKSKRWKAIVERVMR